MTFSAIKNTTSVNIVKIVNSFAALVNHSNWHYHRLRAAVCLFACHDLLSYPCSIAGNSACQKHAKHKLSPLR